MTLPKEVMELENRSVGIDREPTLFAAYMILKQLWDEGDRDRELALHLMFLAWFGMTEPVHITGFPKFEYMDQDLQTFFSEVHDFFVPTICSDPEMMYIVGLIANMFGHSFDNPEKWEKIAKDYQWRYRIYYRYGIDPSIFENRGAYGDYFFGQANVENGY
jgi:hypothetical protein